jgi:hypothetical protein
MFSIEVPPFENQSASASATSSHIHRLIYPVDTLCVVKPSLETGLRHDSFTVQTVHGAEKANVVQFLQAQFDRHFAAQIGDNCPEFCAVRSHNGTLLAGFGLTRDSDQFFCRAYVGSVRPLIRSAFPESVKQPVRLVEVAHLAVANARCLCLIAPAIAHFLAASAEYLICTVTEEVARFFEQQHLATHTLGQAHLAQLPSAEGNRWGRYYDHNPVVLAGDLSAACAQFDRNVAVRASNRG